MEELLGLLRAGSPWLATAIALLVTWLTHRRAVLAQSDKVEVDRVELIQQGYQGVLDELKAELIRQKEERAKDREEIRELKAELREERKRVIELERLVGELQVRLGKMGDGYYEEDEQP